MSNKIALVSCVSKKQKGIHKAKDLYVSDWFKKARIYVENNNYNKWYILSAKHYLVEPEKELGYYELYLPKQSKEYKREWGLKVSGQLIIPNDKNVEIDIFAGVEYRKHLVPLLEARGFNVNVPMQGLGIGSQLKWFKDRL